LVKAQSRRFARKSERGTTVMVVVLATTLITAIGVYAVRNAGQVDMAVGYSRQAAQTTAVAELGTTAALAQIAVNGARFYLDKMDGDIDCSANPSKTQAADMQSVTTCYPLSQGELERASAEPLFKAAAKLSGETGSFGPYSDVRGAVGVELTEKHKTNNPVKGEKQGSATYYDVTMTTTGKVRPPSSTADECADGAAETTVKKVVRAHTIIGPADAQ
jgi:hypothetical protein